MVQSFLCWFKEARAVTATRCLGRRGKPRPAFLAEMLTNRTHISLCSARSHVSGWKELPRIPKARYKARCLPPPSCEARSMNNSVCSTNTRRAQNVCTNSVLSNSVKTEQTKPCHPALSLPPGTKPTPRHRAVRSGSGHGTEATLFNRLLERAQKLSLHSTWNRTEQDIK